MRHRKGTISIEFLVVFICLIFVFLILWAKVYGFNEETERYKEETEAEKISLILIRNLEMASYSDGYSSYISIYPKKVSENCSIEVMENYIVFSFNENDYFFRFNSMELLKKSGGFFNPTPFELIEGEYSIKNINGVVYLEKI